MLEGTPFAPFDGKLSSLLNVEEDMKNRYFEKRIFFHTHIDVLMLKSYLQKTKLSSP